MVSGVGLLVCFSSFAFSVESLCFRLEDRRGGGWQSGKSQSIVCMLLLVFAHIVFVAVSVFPFVVVAAACCGGGGCSGRGGACSFCLLLVPDRY